MKRMQNLDFYERNKCALSSLTLVLLFFFNFDIKLDLMPWCLFSECLGSMTGRESPVRISNILLPSLFLAPLLHMSFPTRRCPAAVGYVCAFLLFPSCQFWRLIPPSLGVQVQGFPPWLGSPQ